MKKEMIVILIFMIIVSWPYTAYATNAAKVLGNGAVSPVMGGTGCVEPQDTGGILINPAGVTKMGNRIDIATEFAVVDAKLDTSGATNFFFRNVNGLHKSKKQDIFAPHMGFASQIGESDWYYGFAAAVTGGFALDYKHSRLSEAVTGNMFDKHASLHNCEFVPTIAYKPIDELSIGVSPVATFNRFETDLANAGFTRTIGNDNGSHAWGMGFNVGSIYDVGDYLSVGVSYKSPRWNYRFADYNDILDKINGPPEYIMGAAITPTEDILLESNVKFIHWRWVDLLEDSPENGGYGWKNQWVFSTGAQYTLLDRLKLRAGYNYGESPIQSDALWANGLSSLISEHHLGIGAGYDITDKFSVDLGWVKTFSNKVEDDGSGDSVSRSGQGAFSIVSVDSFFLGFSYKFE